MKIDSMNSYMISVIKLLLKFIARMHEYVVILMNPVIVSHNELTGH